MSRDYPDWINPHKAAQARREFSGSVLLTRLDRVLDLIDPADGDEIGFEIGFHLDDQRQACARVRVYGLVPMVCQRTLERYQQPIDSASVVGMVDSLRAAEALPEDYDPLVLEESRIRLEDLIAEELLLGLPLVPRAPDSAPVGDRERSAPSETHRPFADLARLAGKVDKD